MKKPIKLHNRTVMGILVQIALLFFKFVPGGILKDTHWSIILSPIIISILYMTLIIIFELIRYFIYKGEEN